MQLLLKPDQGYPLILVDFFNLDERVQAGAQTGRQSPMGYDSNPSDVLKEIDPDIVGDAIRRNLGGVHDARARMLRLLVKEPGLKTSQLAERINRSPASVRRYLAILRSKGLDALFSGTPHRRRLTLRQRETLFSEVRAGRFSSLEEIRVWVQERYGVCYTVAGVQKLLKEEMRYVRRIMAEEKGSCGPDSERMQRLLTFLNALPVSTDGNTWIQEMCTAFSHLYPSLATVLVLLNRSSAIDGKGGRNIKVTHIDIRTPPDRKGAQEQKVLITRKFDSLDKIHESMLKAGRDIRTYHPPIDIVVRIIEDDWIGRILLYFPKTVPDPRVRVSAELEMMRPFLTFCLSDGLARIRSATPQHHAFQQAIDRLSYRYGLTLREKQVLLHYIGGSTIDDISDDLGITISTIRNHIYKMHRKTRTRHQRELFKLLMNI